MSEEDFSDLSPEEIQDKINVIETDPYCLTNHPEGKPVNHQYRESLLEKRSKLYEALHPPAARKYDADRVDIMPVSPPLFSPKEAKVVSEYMADREAKTEAEQQKLEDELREVTDGLSEITEVDYEESFDGKNYQEKIDSYRILRYLNDGDLEKAKPEIMRTANAALKASGNTVEARARVELLQNFLETATNSLPDLDFLAEIVTQIYDARIGEN